MSSFNSYGKFDETDNQAMHKALRRRTRKRITIITLSTIVLIGIVCAAVFGTIAQKNANDDENSNHNNNNAQSLSTSVKALCDVTLYKDACYSSLGPLVHSGQQVRPEELFIFSIQVALTEVSKGVEYFSEHGGFSGLNVDNKTKEALRNCEDLLGLAADHLNSSLSTSSSSGKSSLLDVLEDLETWLSAAGTYQQTCIDGIEEVEQALMSSVSNNLKNSTEFTSNSLAIITWLNKAASSLNFRRLLSLSHSHHHNNEEPKWFHSKDRKLLQTDADLRKKADIVVAKDGSGKYKTISAALKHVTDKSDKRTVIYVKKGIYYENVRVEKTKWNVMIIGDGMSATIVSGSLNFIDGTPTFSSATFAVFGKNFIARDMGFHNTAGPQKQQAVALLTSADLAVFYKCNIEAYQDTLYSHTNRQFYKECNIYGTVDFIFGNSAVVLQNCNILPRVPMTGQQNTITAQGKTDPNTNTGISIQNCNISPFGNLSSVQTYLGRPWKDYSTTVIMQSTLGSFIDSNGWLPWVGNSAPDTIFYAEFQNVGAGSSTKNRVKWKGVKTITSKQASMFTVKTFLSGDRWIPASGAPFKSSL